MLKATVGWTVIGAIAVLFCVACVIRANGPMNMRYDTCWYLEMAESIRNGTPTRHYFPIGYPLVLVGLGEIGCDGNRGIIALNVLSLALGLTLVGFVATRHWGFSALEYGCLCAYTLSSRIVFELATAPQPEMLVLMLSAAVLLCLTKAIESCELRWIVIAAALTAVCVSLRTAWIAICPAVVWSAWRVDRDRGLVVRLFDTATLSLSLIGLASIVGNVGQYSETAARPVFKAMGMAGALIATQNWRWEELSELAANAGYFSTWPPQIRPALWLAGALFACLVAIGAWKQRNSPVAVFIVAYATLLGVYPYFMLRFWAPVAPFVFCLAWLGCKSVASRLTWPTYSREVFVAAYCSCFAYMGLIKAFRLENWYLK